MASRPKNPNARTLKIQEEEKVKRPVNPNARTLKTTRPVISPEIMAMIDAPNEREAMVASLKKRDAEKGDQEFHYCYMDPETPDRVHAQKGYEPVTDEDGEKIRVGRDPLWRRPIEAHQAMQERNEMLSKAAIASSLSKDNPDNVARGRDGEQHYLHAEVENV